MSLISMRTNIAVCVAGATLVPVQVYLGGHLQTVCATLSCTPPLLPHNVVAMYISHLPVDLYLLETLCHPPPPPKFGVWKTGELKLLIVILAMHGHACT